MVCERYYPQAQIVSGWCVYCRRMMERAHALDSPHDLRSLDPDRARRLALYGRRAADCLPLFGVRR